MSRVDEARKEAERQLEESRKLAVTRLAEVKEAVTSEIGWIPKGAPWLLALVAGAGGFAMGFRRKRKRRNR
jgi:hypothetical protein